MASVFLFRKMAIDSVLENIIPIQCIAIIKLPENNPHQKFAPVIVCSQHCLLYLPSSDRKIPSSKNIKAVGR